MNRDKLSSRVCTGNTVNPLTAGAAYIRFFY